MTAAQLDGCRKTYDAMTQSVLKVKPLTAREMAERPHRLSRDGKSATVADGGRWVWDERFEHWAKMM